MGVKKMKQLSKAALKRAETFIGSGARPLEEALFAVHIRGAAPDWALRELAAFQNEDGGFGRGLEPDLQVTSSSVLATTVVLQICRELGISSENELVQGAMRYLLDIYDEAAKAWPIIPPNADDAPHAPWWQYDPDLSHYLSNPRAEIVGYLLDYADLVPNKLGKSLLAAVLAHLETLNGEIEMHDLLCYLRLLATKTLPENERIVLYKQLRPVVESTVSRDAAAWSQYGLKPLVVVPHPSAPFAALLAEAINDNLDYEIEQQAGDGSWEPTWSWGDSYPEAWPHARRAWQGVLTVKTIRTFSAYGRIAS
jgi:hypothetical protein